MVSLWAKSMKQKPEHRQMTKAYFDRIADAEGDVWSGNVDKWAAMERFFESIPESGSVLECGAGTGMYTLRMLRRGLRVTAVDISGKALEVTRSNASENGLGKSLETVEADFMDFAGRARQQFDAVTYFKTLHHFPDLGSIEEAIKAGYRLLKTGGTLLGLEPNGNCPFWRPFSLVRGRHGAGKQSVWEAERGLLMITERNLTRIFQELEEARWEFHWPYVIPAFVARRRPALCEPVNRLLGASLLKRYSFNLIFQVWKAPASEIR